jgi:POT family proton-dependent oligopeptide transporter
MDKQLDPKEKLISQVPPLSDDQISGTPEPESTADTPGPVGLDLPRNAITRFFASHPTGFWFFFWGEFAERCSFYGMRAILATYMADQLGLGQANAGTYNSFFIAACYFLPLVGGYVADNFFGKYWTIVGFSIPYILGHIILGIETIPFMVIALVLLAMGSGVIKPNISTLMGLTYDQFRPGMTKLRSDGFAIFYFSINIGAGISQIMVPMIRTRYDSYPLAFAFPAALMVVALGIFAAGKRFYATEVIRKSPLTHQERDERLRVLSRILGLFLLVMFFWAIFDQASSTWIFFAYSCMNCTLFGQQVDPEQIQAFNSFFIVALLPPVTLFWKWLDKRGFRVRPTDKMVVGFLLTAACMGVMALSAVLAGNAHLRPAIVEADNVKVSVQSGDKDVVLAGSIKTAIADDNRVNITVTRKMPTEDGKEKEVKDAYILTGTGVLQLQTDDQKQNAVVIGHATKLVKKVKDDIEELAEGTLKVSIKEASHEKEAKLSVQDRWFVEPDDKVTVWWQVFAYLIITIAEILISVTGLELAYTAAPKSMTGFVTGCWLVTVGLGNLVINAPITRLYSSMQPMAYFGMLAVMMLVVTGAFVFVARRFNRAAESKPL